VIGFTNPKTGRIEAEITNPGKKRTPRSLRYLQKRNDTPGNSVVPVVLYGSNPIVRPHFQSFFTSVHRVNPPFVP
jgi:hypothetical protein